MTPVNLRVVVLGAAVTAAVLLPLVATAGQLGPVGPSGDPVRSAEVEARGEDDGKAGGEGGAGEAWQGLGPGSRTPESAVPAISADSPAPPVPSAPPAPTAPERITRCGPELASPGGAEAQTCVLNEGSDVWARTYYRNATRQELDAFLTLMAPGGRTVHVRCGVPAQDEPGTCETPRERGAGVVTAYTAVAEFAGAGGDGSTPLLLRAGSNAAGDEGS
ncbi:MULTISPECIES: hypothetical protein [unclassified Streptomyces]|uniref:hypothetical protein n=1 Tax=unclassified Streptomyces TaxID=2593676 RepID=UPI0006AE2425|nr:MULTISPECIES: hypothetical protein [unclassified Streptomyces]KOX38591.1 hypothetical protein ADL06_00880 [Streptomyces sp. NRRL F-6491]KOX52586.1 hypothetical protein ADL08_00290 [Streptomyces sp. NRRL F-6492]